MNKIIYTSVGIVLVLSILAWSYFSDQENKTSEPVNEANAITVSMPNPVDTNSTSSSATTTVVSDTKKYTLADVAVHNKKSDCWMVVNNSVLDVTSFVDKHPGGDKILQGCGKDATSYFNKVPGHLKGIAQVILKKLKIGDLQ